MSVVTEITIVDLLDVKSRPGLVTRPGGMRVGSGPNLHPRREGPAPSPSMVLILLTIRDQHVLRGRLRMSGLLPLIIIITRGLLSQSPVCSPTLDDQPRCHSPRSTQIAGHGGVYGNTGPTWKTPPTSSPVVGRHSLVPEDRELVRLGSQFLSWYCQRWPGGHPQQSCRVFPSPPGKRKSLSSWMCPARVGEPSYAHTRHRDCGQHLKYHVTSMFWRCRPSSTPWEPSSLI